MQVLEEIFPRDKLIFLMCGGGGYAWMTKQILVELEYDATKVYNIGGFWAYTGNHKVEIGREEAPKGMGRGSVAVQNSVGGCRLAQGATGRRRHQRVSLSVGVELRFTSMGYIFASSSNTKSTAAPS